MNSWRNDSDVGAESISPICLQPWQRTHLDGKLLAVEELAVHYVAVAKVCCQRPAFFDQ